MLTCDYCKRKLSWTRYYWWLHKPGRYCSPLCRDKATLERAPRYVKSHNPFYDDEFKD